MNKWRAIAIAAVLTATPAAGLSDAESVRQCLKAVREAEDKSGIRNISVEIKYKYRLESVAGGKKYWCTQAGKWRGASGTAAVLEFSEAADGIPAVDTAFAMNSDYSFKLVRPSGSASTAYLLAQAGEANDPGISIRARSPFGRFDYGPYHFHTVTFTKFLESRPAIAWNDCATSERGGLKYRQLTGVERQKDGTTTANVAAEFCESCDFAFSGFTYTSADGREKMVVLLKYGSAGDAYLGLVAGSRELTDRNGGHQLETVVIENPSRIEPSADDSFARLPAFGLAEIKIHVHDNGSYITWGGIMAIASLAGAAYWRYRKRKAAFG